jgi:predicted MFS family arabinose efflux permease
VIGSIVAGVLLLAAFLRHEARTAAPMVPLGLFRSHDFTGINLLTLLVYGALGGAFFFLPFALVQIHGYTATAVGVTYLPFTLILAALSRWFGGLLTRFGARRLLIVGPAISALGFGLLALPGAQSSPAASFLLPMIVLGFGMAVTVAPLTTALMDAVPARQVGVASGINNAVAAVASLLVIAVLGTIAVVEFDRSLDRHLESTAAPAEVRRAVDEVRGGLVPPPHETAIQPEVQPLVRRIIVASWVDTTRLVMLAMAALAVTGAVSVAFSLRSG